MFWGGGIIVYRTYALYQEDKEYNVIKGIVPDFGYDVKLAIEVDGKKETSVPERGLYKTNVVCNNDATGVWDYNAWNLKIDNLKKDTKCNVTFTSGLSEVEYEEYLEVGIALRRNTYRGKDISDLYTSGKLYEQIGKCTFDDIYVGDYFTTNENNKNVTWLIADLNNYLHTGDQDVHSKNGYSDKAGGGLMACHATIIPATYLDTNKMNTQNTTGVVDDVTEGMTGHGKGAYVGSYMWNVTLPKVLTDYIKPAFGEHVIKTRNLLADAMVKDRSNQNGNNTGASSGWAWYDSQVDLMSEVNVYGSTVFSSSGYDIGIDNRQYAIFKLKPEFINSYGTTRFGFWLKAVASSSTFARVNEDGVAHAPGASDSYGVRPRFLIN